MVLKSRVTLGEVLINVCVLLWVVSMNVYELVGGSVQELFRKATLLILFGCALICCFKKINLKLVILVIICLITGFVNYKYVGNTMISNQIIVMIYIFASLLLSDPRLNEKTVRLAIYMNIAVIMFRFIVVGLFQRVYIVSSNNFISVYLLLPTVVYYTLLEKRKKTFELYTAFFVWCVCLLGLGRGGILCSSLLLIGLCCYKYKDSKTNIRLLVVGIVFIAVVALIPFLSLILYRFSSLEVLSMFRQKGFESHSREEIWQNYLKQATKTGFNVIFGGNNAHTIAAQQFNGNTHNTFLNIHVHNGIIPLIIFFVMIIINTVQAIEKRCWIYCLCTYVVLLRGFTDMIFWLNLGTPVFFYLLLYHFNSDSSQKEKVFFERFFNVHIKTHN